MFINFKIAKRVCYCHVQRRTEFGWRLEQEEVENPTLEILVTYLVSCEAQDSYEQIIAGKKTRQNL
jgi:hypothetical protein